MNLQEFASENNLSIVEVETFLRGKGKILFSRTFPLSDDVILLLNSEYASRLSGADSLKNGVSVHRSVEEKNAHTLNQMINIDEIETLFGKTLQSYISEGYHLIIDTCSILRKPHAFEWFYKRCKPLLVEYNRVLEIPYSVYAELATFTNNRKTDYNLLKRAEYGMELIKTEIQEGCITIIGSREDTTTNREGEKRFFADDFFTRQILAWRNNNESVLLITQDYDLTVSALKLQEIPCVNSNAEIVVRKLDQRGRLVNTVTGDSERNLVDIRSKDE